MHKVYEKSLSNVYIAYAFVVIYHQILHVIIPIDIWLGEHASWLSPTLVWLGIGLLLMDIVTKQYFWDRKYAAPLIVLLAVMCLSSISYVRVGEVSKDAEIIILQAIQMLVIFPLGKRMTGDEVHRFFKTLYAAVSVLWVPGMLVSFCQFFYGVFYYQKDTMRQGFGQGRLFGIFSYTYFTTLLCVLLVCISLYYVRTAKKQGVRIWAAIEAILCLVYIVLSGTRTAIFAMMVTIFVCVGLFLYGQLKEKAYPGFLHIGASIGIALCASVLLLVICRTTNAGLKWIPNTVVPRIQQTLAENNTLGLTHKIGLHLAYFFYPADAEGVEQDVSTKETKEEQIKELVMETKEVKVEREDVKIDNISNNRFTIWKAYFDAVASDIHSILLGFTPGNFMSIIFDRFPDSFVVTYIQQHYPNMYANRQIYDPHCTYVSVIVTTGLLGTVTLCWFLLRCLIAVLRYAADKRTYDFYFLLAAIIIIMVSAGFDGDLFFRSTYSSMLFWLLSGILLKRIGAFPEQKPEASRVTQTE